MNIRMLTAILKELPATTVFKLGFANPHSYRGYYHQLGLKPLDDVKVTTMIEALMMPMVTPIAVGKVATTS